MFDIDMNEPSALKTNMAILEVVAGFTAAFTAAGMTLVISMMLIWHTTRFFARLTLGIGGKARHLRRDETGEPNIAHTLAIALAKHVPRVWPSNRTLR